MREKAGCIKEEDEKMDKLIEYQLDVQKRITELYNDDECPYDIPEDIAGLKVLQDVLKKEKTRRRLEKQEKTKYTKKVKNFLTKLATFIKEDFYLYNGVLLCPGPNSERDMKQRIFCVVSDEYKEAIDHIFFAHRTDNLLYRINRISDLKEIVTQYLEDGEKILPHALSTYTMTLIQGDTKEKMVYKMEYEYDKIQEEYDMMVPFHIPDDPEIESLKKIFTVQYSSSYPKLEVNLNLFPYVTNKETTQTAFMSKEWYHEPDDLLIYYARVYIRYICFDIYVKILYF